MIFENEPFYAYKKTFLIVDATFFWNIMQVEFLKNGSFYAYNKNFLIVDATFF